MVGRGRGILSPERSLTKICWVGDGGVLVLEVSEVEDAVEEEREERIVDSVLGIRVQVTCPVDG